MDRRKFLGTMTAATVLSRNLAWAAGEHKIDKVGLQLYTIRSVMKEIRDAVVKIAERITVAGGVPTQWAKLLEDPGLDTVDTGALRIAGSLLPKGENSQKDAAALLETVTPWLMETRRSRAVSLR